MKKIIPLILIFTLLFSACTVQETVDPQVFLDRLSKADENLAFSEDGTFYENNSCVTFFEFKGKSFVAEQFCGGDGVVTEICLSSETADENCFSECTETFISVYAPNENSAEIISNLFKDGYSYYETQWYSYSSYTDGKTRFFCVKNKKLSPTQAERLTLREE